MDKSRWYAPADRLGRRHGRSTFLDEAFWRNVEILDPRHEKSTITMRVDDDVLDFFKRGGSGYQSRMNAVLRAYVFARRERSK